MWRRRSVHDIQRAVVGFPIRETGLESEAEIVSADIGCGETPVMIRWRMLRSAVRSMNDHALAWSEMSTHAMNLTRAKSPSMVMNRSWCEFKNGFEKTCCRTSATWIRRRLSQSR